MWFVLGITTDSNNLQVFCFFVVVFFFVLFCFVFFCFVFVFLQYIRLIRVAGEMC